MLRGWMLAAACFGTLFITQANAQGVSLAERLGLVARESNGDANAARVMYDPNVRQAADTTAGQPRAPRDAATSQPRRGSTRSLFGGFRLPNLLGGSSTPRTEDLANPPMAYDPAELNGGTVPGGTTGAAMRPPVRRQTATAGAAPRTAAGMPRTTAGGPRTSAGAMRSTAAAPATVPATPRVVRGSPRPDNRHNELADALTGLRSGTTAGDATEEIAAEDMPAGSGSDMTDSATPPAADMGEAAPSYLSDDDASAGGAAPAPRSTAARGTASGPVDLHDALLGSDEYIGSTAPATAAPAPAATAPGPRPRPPRGERQLRPAARSHKPRQEAVRKRPWRTTPQPWRTRRPTAPAKRSVESPPHPLPKLTRRRPPQPPRRRHARPLPLQNLRTTTQRPAYIGNLRPKTPDVLASCKAPLVVSSVAGPQRIVVGQIVEYRVTLENTGADAAHETIATVTVPGTAEVIDAVASNGSVDQPAPTSEGQPRSIQWRCTSSRAAGRRRSPSSSCRAADSRCNWQSPARRRPPAPRRPSKCRSRS